MKILKILALTIIFIVVQQTTIFAQSVLQNVQVVLNAVVLDSASGQIKDAEYLFTDASGKAIKGTTLDGKLKVVLEAGEEYSVRLATKGAFPKVMMYEVEDVEVYQEMQDTFYVNELRAGAVLAEYALFIPKKAELSEEGKSQIKMFLDDLKKNRSLKVLCAVSGDKPDPPIETKGKKKAKKTPKGKKKKGEPAPVIIGTQELLQQRIEAVRQFIENEYKAGLKRIEFQQASADKQVIIRVVEL